MRSERLDTSLKLSRWFGARAGSRGAEDISPVIVADDLRSGPFAPFRRFHAWYNNAASVGNFSYVGLANAGPSKTYAIVDRVIYRVTAAAGNDLAVQVLASSPIATNSAANGFAMAIEQEQSLTLVPVSEVYIRYTTDPTAPLASATFYPGSQDLLAKTLEGPFVVGAGGLVLVCPAIINCGLFACFQGRFYDAP